MSLKILIENKLKQLKKSYKQTGKEFFTTTCLNPHHNDTHPSFYINFITGKGKCWTCGFKVDKEYWIDGKLDEEEIEKIEREQKYLALKRKLKEAEINEGEYDIKTEIVLPPKESDISFLCENNKYRGISIDTYNKLNVYYCDKGKYKNRIIFPIEYNNEVKAFSTRTLDKKNKNKYIHSLGFNSKELIYPYNLLKEFDKNYVVLVEGVFDALSLYELGIPSICNWGVGLNMNHKKITILIKDFGIDALYIALDEDEVGIKAATEYKNYLKHAPFEIKFGYELKELKNYYKSKAKDINEYLQGVKK